MLSNACKYAIRGVIYLALNSDASNKLGAKRIARELEVPQPYLAQLLRKLAADRLISSSKGPGGGFFLEETNRGNSVWDIVTAIDGPYRFDDCFLGLSKCDDTSPCPVHHIVSPFKEALLEEFRQKSIAILAQEIQENGRLISLRGVLESGE